MGGHLFILSFQCSGQVLHLLVSRPAPWRRLMRALRGLCAHAHRPDRLAAMRLSSMHTYPILHCIPAVEPYSRFAPIGAVFRDVISARTTYLHEPHEACFD